LGHARDHGPRSVRGVGARSPRRDPRPRRRDRAETPRRRAEDVRRSDSCDPAAMISFAFTEEQKDFRLTLERFAHDTLLPGYRDRASSTDFPWDVQRRLASMGVLGIGLPEECGGSGAEDPILLGLATEALAEGDIQRRFRPGAG